MGDDAPSPIQERSVHENAFDDLLDYLAREAVEEMGADRSSIFLLDEERRELWSRVALGVGQRVIRIPADRGIAGHVATTGELLNVVDPYADPRFNPAVDRATGYRTRSILCGPLRSRDGRVVGVLQILNKRDDGPFLDVDVQRFTRVASRCGFAIDNALTFDRLRRAERSGVLPAVRSPRVLVADRDLRVVAKVRDLLMDELVVLPITTFRDVLRAALDETPDLVVLGIDGDGDGQDVIATCRALRACPSVRETPILLLATPGHPDQVVAAFEAGANDFLPRSFAPAQLRAKAHTWLLRSGTATSG